VSGLGQGNREAAAADRELEDRPAGARGQGQVEVQVARVVEEVQVVQPGERGRGRRIRPVQP
jgi:hypothetical protein